MKKAISSAIVTALVLGSVAPAAFAASNFSDVQGSYAKQAIEELAAKGILNGVDANHFNPNGTLSRAAFAKIVVLSLGLEATATTSSFSDVTGWAVPYVEAAKAAGLINGVGGGMFDPNGVVTREAAAKILVGALKTKVQLGDASDVTFTDASSISDWAKPFVAVAAKYNLIQGFDGKFDPQGSATRAQAAVLAQRLISKVEDAAKEYAITPGTSNLAVGQAQQFKVEGAKNVAWSADGGVIDQNGNFIASAAGNYTVTAVVDGIKTLTQKVSVYGQAAGVKFATVSDMVANSKSTQTITANIVDANGNVVADFNGTVTVTDTWGKIVTNTNLDGSVASVGDNKTVTVKNGVATFALQSPAAPGLTDTIQTSALTTAPAGVTINYGTVKVNSVAQVASAITVDAKAAANASSAKKSYISVNGVDGSDSVFFQVQVNDQTGNPMLGGTYTMTASVSGGGKLNGVTTGNQKTVVVSGGTPQFVQVDSVQGATGTYALTVTSNGLQTGTGTVSAVVAGNAAKLVASNSNPSFTQADGVGTTFTLSATDAQGAPVAFPTTVTPKVYITDSNGKAVTKFTVVGATLDTADGGYLLAANTTSVVIKDTTGVGPLAGAYNVFVKDVSTTNALAQTPVATFTVKANTLVASMKLSAGKTILVGPNTTTTVSVQAVDASGNAIAAPANQKVTFSAAQDKGSVTVNGVNTPVEVPFDATGKASVTVAAQDYDGAVVTVSAVSASLNASTSLYVTDHAVSSFSFGLKNTSTSSYTNSTVYAQAGDTVGITVAGSIAALDTSAKDSNGNAIIAPNDPVSLVINHASGLSGLPTPTSAVVARSNDTINDTVTYTGKLSDVSTLIGTTLTTAKAGVVTLTLTDTATNAVGSAAINVVASTTVAAVAVPEFKLDTTVKPSSTNLFTVQLVDAGGNSVVATADTVVTLATAAGNGLSFQDINHAPTTTLVIKQGTSSVQGYLATDTTGGGTFTATPNGVPAFTSGTITVQ